MEDGRNIERVKQWLELRKECRNYNNIIKKFTDSKFTDAVKYTYSGEGDYYTALVGLLTSELKRLNLHQERVNFYNKRKEFESANTQTDRATPDSKYGWTPDNKAALAEINKTEEEFRVTQESGSIATSYGDRDSTTGSNPSFSQIPK
jgi:hypothetical protein